MGRSLEQRKRVLHQVHRAIITASIGKPSQFADVFRILHEEGKISTADLATEMRTTEAMILRWIEGNDIPDDREWGWMINAIAQFIHTTLEKWEIHPPSNPVH